MKPNIQYTDKKSGRDLRGAQSFPKTDYNYHTATLANIGGRCLSLRRPSFRMISQGYFKNEARVDFVTEAALFSVIVATVAVPLLHSASALLHLVRSVGF